MRMLPSRPIGSTRCRARSLAFAAWRAAIRTRKRTCATRKAAKDRCREIPQLLLQARRAGDEPSGKAGKRGRSLLRLQCDAIPRYQRRRRSDGSAGAGLRMANLRAFQIDIQSGGLGGAGHYLLDFDFAHEAGLKAVAVQADGLNLDRRV